MADHTRAAPVTDSVRSSTGSFRGPPFATSSWPGAPAQSPASDASSVASAHAMPCSMSHNTWFRFRLPLDVELGNRAQAILQLRCHPRSLCLSMLSPRGCKACLCAVWPVLSPCAMARGPRWPPTRVRPSPPWGGHPYLCTFQDRRRQCLLRCEHGTSSATGGVRGMMGRETLIGTPSGFKCTIGGRAIGRLWCSLWHHMSSRVETPSSCQAASRG